MNPGVAGILVLLAATAVLTPGRAEAEESLVRPMAAVEQERCRFAAGRALEGASRGRSGPGRAARPSPEVLIYACLMARGWGLPGSGVGRAPGAARGFLPLTPAPKPGA